MAANANKVWRWERWEVIPDLDTQLTLARALNVPAEMWHAVHGHCGYPAENWPQ